MDLDPYTILRREIASDEQRILQLKFNILLLRELKGEFKDLSERDAAFLKHKMAEATQELVQTSKQLSRRYRRRDSLGDYQKISAESEASHGD